MEKDRKFSKRFGSVVTAGLVASVLAAAPVTVLVGPVPALAAEPQSKGVAEIRYNRSDNWTSIESQTALLDALNNLNGSAEIIMNGDINLTESTESFIINNGASVELYLNGHKIEKNF